MPTMRESLAHIIRTDADRLIAARGNRDALSALSNEWYYCDIVEEESPDALDDVFCILADDIAGRCYEWGIWFPSDVRDICDSIDPAASNAKLNHIKES